MTASTFAAIDFGTSNSAIALPDGAAGVALVEVEPGWQTMPTAVFYRAEPGEAECLFGRAAIAAYVDGLEGRLMRSMKSVLGSGLLHQATDVGAGRAVRFTEVIGGYLAHLKHRAEMQAGAVLDRVVLGRPVFFVDDDAPRDAQAQAALAQAARSVGFREVLFQYEPVAAALDLERRLTREQCVLVADIGGGTSDFSLLRLGGAGRGLADRRDDILGHHGVHLAGTDFDRHLELSAILPLAGYRSLRPAKAGEAPREVPSKVYFDLATWHLIPTVYAPPRVAELQQMRPWYADPAHHRRLMRVLQQRLGHALAAAAEQAKIDVAAAGEARLPLPMLEPGLEVRLEGRQAGAAIEADLARIVEAAVETAKLAGVGRSAVDTLYFTGGSTGWTALVDRISQAFPVARPVRGDRFASVAQGLGWHARAVFGPGR